MTGLGPILARLGIEQYLDSFIVEGFDTWETVLDIQEGDLDVLNVKLGHRRKLQREIANQRAASHERSGEFPVTEAPGENGKFSDSSPTPITQHDSNGAETKRKYRRHPKPDKNAPERPPSAYVIFSNQVREEVRTQNLSFTEIAKLVGDRWQKLTLEEKGPFELEASTSKEKFNAELAQYKKTELYKQYTNYIAEFKAKHSVSTVDGKRPRFEADSNSGSGSSRSNEFNVEPRPRASTVHTRDISNIPINSTSYHGRALSPKGDATATSPKMTEQNMRVHYSRTPAMSSKNSPPLLPDLSQPRAPPVLSIHGSVASAPYSSRGDLPGLHSRAEQPSLASSTGTNLPIKDLASFAFANRTSNVYPPSLHQQHSSLSSGTHSDSSCSSNAPLFNPVGEPCLGQSSKVDFKAKSADWPRIYDPPCANNHSASFDCLPPLQASDRFPDLIRDPTHRTLPFPAVSSPPDINISFRGHQAISMPPPPSKISAISSSLARDELNSPLEPSESEAINALTVLAFTGR